LEGQAWRKLEESLKDYCPIIIVKKEADWGYRNGVFAQELYSLILNKKLELYLNTMEYIIFEYNGKHCIWIQYIINNILYTVHNILYIIYCI
jgi:hypothetical protein